MFNIIKILNLFFSKTKIKVSLFITLTLLSMILEIFSIGMIFPVFSVLLSNEPLNINFLSNKIEIDLVNINNLLIILVSAYLIKNLYLLFFNYWQAKFGNVVYVEASKALLKKYFLDDYIFFSEHNSSSLVQNVYVETKCFAEIVKNFLTLLIEILIILSVATLLCIINFKVTLASILVFTLIFVLYNRFIKIKINKWGNDRIKFGKLSLKNLNEIFDGIKTIKIYGVEKNFLNLYTNNIKKFARMATYHSSFVAVPKIILEITSILIIVTTIYYLLFLGLSFQSMVPYLAVVAGAAFRLLPSINRIMVSIQNINFYKPSSEILQREFGSKKNDFIKHDKLPIIHFKKQILIKNFNFKYEKEGNFIFENQNLILNKFDCMGLMGESGVGKTTLVDLLMCLYKFEKGEIIIDGYKLKNDLEYKAWQKKIGYVAQKIFLINDTIRKNIALGVEDSQIDNQKILSVVGDAQLGEFIKKCNGGVNYNIQEKGTNISEGEKQRLGIARALYNSPDLIILDEPTSSLDENTELNFLNFLNKFKKHKTLIIISHKKSNMKICNRIVKIENSINGQKKIIEFE